MPFTNAIMNIVNIMNIWNIFYTYKAILLAKKKEADLASSLVLCGGGSICSKLSNKSFHIQSFLSLPLYLPISVPLYV